MAMRLKDRPGGSLPSIWCFSMRMFFWKISGDALMGAVLYEGPIGNATDRLRRRRRDDWGTIGDRREGDHVYEDPLGGGKHSGPVEPVGLRNVIQPHR